MLNRSNMQWSGKTLANQIKKENVLFDCAVQRSFVWDMTKKRMLIDSIIRNYPINALFFNRRKDFRWDRGCRFASSAEEIRTNCLKNR